MRRILSAIWRGLGAVVRFARRRLAIFWGIVILVQFLCNLSLWGKLDEKTTEAVYVVQNQQSAQQTVAEAVATLPPNPGVPIGRYDIVLTAGENPKGELSWRTPYTCGGGCGSFKGTIELQGIRVISDQEFVLDLKIVISEANGDPWLFEGNLGDIILEINGQEFKPVASSFPTQVTEPVVLNGFLTFLGQIPLADPINPQYGVILRIQTRLSQPLEGWLTPHQ